MMDLLIQVAKFWVYCSIFNVTLLTISQFKNPVCEKAHRELMFMHAFAGPISTIGGIIFIGYMSLKRLNQ